ncbi:MAG: alanine racemase [Gemmatimonadales bacterium]|nr:alanine racemase [Gemmatimonadales bacterium]MBP6570234.1 alanine racemase [Gemmatimonadales bacterium]MBP7619593.1 alanine racemase [Gemmatimonadales bacterium]
MTDFSAVATPALVIDLAQVDRNCARVAAYAADNGLTWRPHVKTHKSAQVAARQLAAGAVGLSCATPREAEVMATVCSDLLLAYPPVGTERLRRTVALAAQVRLTVMLDSLESATALSEALAAPGASARVLIEVDAGMRRTGVVGVEPAVELARAVAAFPGLTFAGFGFYPGQLRSAGPEVDAELVRLSVMVAALRAGAEASGLVVHTISAGSTPLLWRSHEIAGLTELRAGTAVYFDRTSVVGGICGPADCAATILATVVSTAVPGQAVVDAGVKALGREPMRGGDADGYACVTDHPEVPVVRLSEEHGVLDLSHTEWRPLVGEQVRLLPNHACVAVHNFGEMTLVHPDGRIETCAVEARGRG